MAASSAAASLPTSNAGGRATAKGKLDASSVESLKRKRGVFTRELRIMMYAFGDDADPIPETVSLVEDMMIDYITEMVHKAQDIASGRGKLTTEDFVFLVRKDGPKFTRARELLRVNEELKEARKAFVIDEEKLALD